MSDLDRLVNVIALDLENRRVWQAPATQYGSYTRTEDTRDILRRALEPLMAQLTSLAQELQEAERAGEALEARYATLERERDALRTALAVAQKALNKCAYPNCCGGERTHLLDIVVSRQEVAYIALQEIEAIDTLNPKP